MADPFKNCSHHELISDAFCRSKKLFEKNNTCPFHPVEQICFLSSYSNPIGHSKDNCYEAFFTMCTIKDEEKHKKDKCVILEKSFMDWCTCEDIVPKNGSQYSNGTRDCVCFPYHVNPYTVHKLNENNSSCVCSNVFRKKCQLFKNNERQYANISCITTNDTLPMEHRLNCSTWLHHHSNRNATNPKVLYKEGQVWRVYNYTTGSFSTVLRNISGNNFNISNLDNGTLTDLEMVEFDLDHLLQEATSNTIHLNETFILRPHHISQHKTITNCSDQLSPSTHMHHSSQNGMSSNQISNGFELFSSSLKSFGLFCLPFTALLLSFVLFFILYKKICKKNHPMNLEPVINEANWDDISFDDSTPEPSSTQQTNPSGVIVPKLSKLQRALRKVRSGVVVFTKDSQDTEILISPDNME